MDEPVIHNGGFSFIVKPGVFFTEHTKIAKIPKKVYSLLECNAELKIQLDTGYVVLQGNYHACVVMCLVSYVCMTGVILHGLA